MAIVSFESNVHDAGEPTMSEDTIGVLGVDEHLGQRAGLGRGPEGVVDLVDGDVLASGRR